MSQSPCEMTWNIVLNIVGGIIVAFLTVLVQWINKKLTRCKFKKVFGKDLLDFYLVYPAYEDPNRDTVFLKPAPKVPRHRSLTVHLTTINSTSITRSIGHLSFAIGTCSPSLPQIRSDIDLDQRMDISFLSLGGLNNYKSLDVLEDPANNFLQFGKNGIHSKILDKSIVNIHGKMDYGLILKIHPENNPSRTWLCVAGIGEWGTSGAAWWLSRHWKKIYKHAKGKPFACITRTIFASDDSTSLVHLFLSNEDVDKAVNTNNTTHLNLNQKEKLV